ncbi:MAG: glycosyltransferase family 1 protein, partial [Calditrichaeota bacterium]
MAGAGRYICGLVSALSRIDTTNEYFIFLKRRDQKRFSGLGENFHLVTLPNLSRPVRIVWEIAAPRQMVRRYGLDVWHSPHYLLPAGLDDVHSVVTFHDLTFFLMPHLYSGTKRRFFQAAIRHAAARADTIVAVSDTTRADARAVFPDLSPEKLVRVYSGTNGTFKPVTNPAALARLKTALQTGSKFVLFVGTLEKRKNLGVLLSAFHRLVHNGHPDARLVVVGKPENGLRQTLEAIRSLGLADRVVLPGYLPDADLPVLYSAASLFAYPSQYEGFGFPVVEAMACGTPVLTSNTSALREISGRSAMQVPPDDEAGWAARMHRVLSDEAFRSSLVDYGLERARRFSWQQTAEQMVEVYSRFRHRRTAIRVTEGQAENPFIARTPEKLSPLGAAILRTLVYSDIFDFPLTEDEVHASLIGATSTREAVRQMLRAQEMRPFVESSEGYFFLRGRGHLVEKRKERARASARLLA